MSALTASAAQATQLEVTTTGPTWLTFSGSKANGGDTLSLQIFKVGTLEVKCAAVSGHATVVPKQTEILATNIAYTECESTIAGTKVTVTMNGCNYKFHGGKTDPLNAEHGIEGEVDLVCPEGKVVEIHIYQNATTHAEGVSLCTLTVPGFKSAKEITTINTPKTSGGIENDFDLKAVKVPVPFTKHGSILCPASGTAEYNGEITVTGFKDEGVDKNGNPVENGSTGVTVS